MTNAEALALAERLQALANVIRSRQGADAVQAEEKFAEIYGQMRSVIADILPREPVKVAGSWNAVTTHDNLIEAGFLSGSGIYEHQGIFRLFNSSGFFDRVRPPTPTVRLTPAHQQPPL